MNSMTQKTVNNGWKTDYGTRNTADIRKRFIPVFVFNW
jgi:hypothetical protein